MDYKEYIEKIARLTKEEMDEFNANRKKIKENNVPIKESLKNTGLIYAGTAGAVGGGGTLNKIYRDGLVDGRVKLYHNTPKENAKSILSDGLKGRYSNDEQSFTKQVMKGLGRDNLSDFDNKVYLARNRAVADSVGMQRSSMKAKRENPFALLQPADMARLNREQNINLKTSIPYEEFKNLNHTDNPELLGAKTKEEFVKKYKQKHPSQLKPGSEKQLNKMFKALGKDTVTLNGDFDAKHFVGGAGHKKNNAKQILEYAAKNKGRMAKGIGLGLGGAALLGAGTYAVGKGAVNNYNAQKESEKKNKPILKRQRELAKKMYTR